MSGFVVLLIIVLLKSIAFHRKIHHGFINCCSLLVLLTIMFSFSVSLGYYDYEYLHIVHQWGPALCRLSNINWIKPAVLWCMVFDLQITQILSQEIAS
ncbi:hypothetical protein QL285_084354 [Trifolium repens]|nr:hypothetical protein QL285_084354 [Trifolium repens]